MFAGIALSVLAGGIWTLTGVVNSCCARFKLDLVTYLLANTLFSLLLTSLLFIHPDGFLSRNTVLLAGILIPAGVLNTSGALALQKGLQKGHHGIVFLIAQSALVLPFLTGVLFFGEKPGALRWLGAGFILSGMIFCAVPKIREEKNGVSTEKGWLFYAVASFLLFGIAQSLMTVPSFWKGFTDGAGVRTPLIYAGSSLLMVTAALYPPVRKTLVFNRTLILCGIIVSILNTASMGIIFSALDLLSKGGIGAIGFPLAISASLVGFTLYSLFVMKEKCYAFTILGLFVILAGGILISL